MLVAVGAAPNLIRQDFPYETDIYPFELNLERLSRTTLARYVYTEASADALDPGHPGNADPTVNAGVPRSAQRRARRQPNRLGSLYDAIIEVSEQVSDLDLPSVGDLSVWVDRLGAIKSEGESGHFAFFRDVFMGTHAGMASRPDAWTLDPSDPAYPSFDLGVNPSAFEGHPPRDPRRCPPTIAWLAGHSPLAGPGAARPRLPQRRGERERGPCWLIWFTRRW